MSPQTLAQRILLPRPPTRALPMALMVVVIAAKRSPRATAETKQQAKKSPTTTHPTLHLVTSRHLKALKRLYLLKKPLHLRKPLRLKLPAKRHPKALKKRHLLKLPHAHERYIGTILRHLNPLAFPPSYLQLAMCSARPRGSYLPHRDAGPRPASPRARCRCALGTDRIGKVR
ncbi:hypothetical protein BU23DRAFT_82991 [Bimuria novae-zelandiae CBS 107.79]|uniref:Uncharacterized protein n=1 Tax=Bimuria novae-zelandiae CBS 107.79 TaxID=1447943 RepID=A0A6A5VF62_9PLEO|nr:hypothetical protein BU23DRAFT_82991 [Bimuria novae-zelandiae CBS 107.79]